MTKSDKSDGSELPVHIREALSEAACQSVSGEYEKAKSEAYRKAQTASSLLNMFQTIFQFSISAFADQEILLPNEYQDCINATLPNWLKERAVEMALEIESEYGSCSNNEQESNATARRYWPEYIEMAVFEHHGLDDEELLYAHPSTLTRTESDIQAALADDIIDIYMLLISGLTQELGPIMGISSPVIPRILYLALIETDSSGNNEISYWPHNIPTWLPEAYERALEENFEKTDLLATNSSLFELGGKHKNRPPREGSPTRPTTLQHFASESAVHLENLNNSLYILSGLLCTFYPEGKLPEKIGEQVQASLRDLSIHIASSRLSSSPKLSSLPHASEFNLWPAYLMEAVMMTQGATPELEVDMNLCINNDPQKHLLISKNHHFSEHEMRLQIKALSICNAQLQPFIDSCAKIIGTDLGIKTPLNMGMIATVLNAISENKTDVIEQSARQRFIDHYNYLRAEGIFEDDYDPSVTITHIQHEYVN